MEQFRRGPVLLAWTIHLRPAFSCIVKKSAQVIKETVIPEHIRGFSRDIVKATSKSVRGPLDKILDVRTIPMIVYTDASFESNEVHSCQLSYVVFLLR